MHCVQIKGSASNPSSVTSGVPQGTVLGPVFFLTLISDISQNLDTNIVCFTDDTRLCKSIYDHSDSSTLQSDLSKFYT